MEIHITLGKLVNYVQRKVSDELNAPLEDRPDRTNSFRIKTKVKFVKSQEVKNMNTLTFLKVKHTSLAAEAKLIRKEEQKVKKQARYFLHKEEDPENNSWKFYSTFHELRDHRKNVVGVEARAAHIASTYIKGKPYEYCENKLDRSRYHLTKVGNKWYKAGFNHRYDAKVWRRVYELVQKYETPQAYRSPLKRRDLTEVIKEVEAWRLQHPLLQE